MLRAMDSAVAGLRSHQNKLDVISNNIANVNTYGYKAQTYSFKEAVYQTATNSTAGSSAVGGNNAAQYGYGTTMGSISTDFTTGTPTYVGGLNAFINGSGFFLTKSTIVKQLGTGSDALKSAEMAFTRVGQMQLNSAGYLTDANGNFVYGYRSNGSAIDTKLDAIKIPATATATTDANGDITGYTFTYADDSALQASSISINSAGEINVTIPVTKTDSTSGTAVTTTEDMTVCIGQLAIASFQNEAGLTKSGDNYYNTSANDNTGLCSVGTPGGTVPTLMTGYLEVSNVDLTKEFSDMITTQRGFQANSKIITVSDEILQEIVNMVR